MLQIVKPVQDKCSMIYFTVKTLDNYYQYFYLFIVSVLTIDTPIDLVLSRFRLPISRLFQFSFSCFVIIRNIWVIFFQRVRLALNGINVGRIKVC